MIASLRTILISFALLLLCGCDKEIAVGKAFSVEGWCENGCNDVKVRWGDGTETAGTSTDETKVVEGKTYRKWEASHTYTTTGDNRDVDCSCDGGTTWTNQITVDVKKPTDETTEVLGWYDDTFSQFKAQLTPTSIDFSGIKVVERDPGGANDGCWFQGAPFGKATGVTGGTWDVGADNWWQKDTVGIAWFAVLWYQDNHPNLPCVVTIPQKMDVVIPGAANIEYTSNTLTTTVGSSTIKNERDDEPHQKSYP